MCEETGALLGWYSGPSTKLTRVKTPSMRSTSQAHRSKEVADSMATHSDDFRLEWLPSYAPDTNPEEQCNAVVKREMLNALPGSVEELRRMARRSFERLQRRPQLLRSFFRHSRLSLH